MSTDVNGIEWRLATVFAIVSDQLSNPLYGSSNPKRDAERKPKRGIH